MVKAFGGSGARFFTAACSAAGSGAEAISNSRPKSQHPRFMSTASGFFYHIAEEKMGRR
jgi:hypothetical protein